MKLPVNISNETLVAELIKNNLVKPEDIVRDGNKMVKPTREEAKVMLEAIPDAPPAGDTGDTTKPVYKIFYGDTEIGQVTDDSLHNEDDGMEIEGLKCTVHDTDKFIKAHSDKEEFKPIIEALNKLLVPETNTQEPWSQEKQVLPNRYYVIPKKTKEITPEGKKIYEELPSYFVNGKWCEDAAGTVECSYYDNLRPEVVKEYRAKGIIR